MTLKREVKREVRRMIKLQKRDRSAEAVPDKGIMGNTPCKLLKDGKVVFEGTANECLIHLQKISPFSWHYSFTYLGYELKPAGQEALSGVYRLRQAKKRRDKRAGLVVDQAAAEAVLNKHRRAAEQKVSSGSASVRAGNTEGAIKQAISARWEAVAKLREWARSNNLTEDTSVKQVGELLGEVGDLLSQAKVKANKAATLIDIIGRRTGT